MFYQHSSKLENVSYNVVLLKKNEEIKTPTCAREEIFFIYPMYVCMDKNGKIWEYIKNSRHIHVCHQRRKFNQ